MNFQQILNKDSGLVARAKLNSMLSALIEGDDGVNAAWIFLRAIEKANRNLSAKESNDVARLEESISGANDYTDRAVNKLYTYVDGIDGGVGGLIDSTSFDPSNLPADKAITLIALGSGTFTNMLDVTGTAITISNPNAITVFYRAAYVTYWNYKSMIITAPPIDSTPTSGNTEHTISSDAVYREVTALDEAKMDKNQLANLLDYLTIGSTLPTDDAKMYHCYGFPVECRRIVISDNVHIIFRDYYGNFYEFVKPQGEDDYDYVATYVASGTIPSYIRTLFGLTSIIKSDLNTLVVNANIIENIPINQSVTITEAQFTQMFGPASEVLEKIRNGYFFEVLYYSHRYPSILNFDDGTYALLTDIHGDYLLIIFEIDEDNYDVYSTLFLSRYSYHRSETYTKTEINNLLQGKQDNLIHTTQEAYDALSQEEKLNGKWYFIEEEE